MADKREFSGTIRLPKRGRDRIEQDLIDILTEQADPDFSLPPIATWEKGARGLTSRTLLILKAGLEHLRTTYPPEGKLEPRKGASASEQKPEKLPETVAGW